MPDRARCRGDAGVARRRRARCRSRTSSPATARPRSPRARSSPAIRIPFLAPGQQFSAYKLSKRFDQDISTVVAAFRLERDGGNVRALRAAYGGMAARAMRAAQARSRRLTGRPWSPPCARRHRRRCWRATSRRWATIAAAPPIVCARRPDSVRRFQLETTSTRADPGRGAMNAPLARIRGGVHAAVAPRQRGRACHRPRALSRRRPDRAGHAGSGAGAEPACACPHPPHRFRPRARRARRHRRDHGRRYSRQERHRADPQRRAAVGRRHRRIRRPAGRGHRRRARSIRRARPQSWSRSNTSRCPPS